MDGIFGVGLAEMLIIALVLFIIGGPTNTAKWARQLGVWVRQGREMWAQVMADLEKDLGPEGKELMDTARELGKGAREVTSVSSPKRLMSNTLKMVESAVDLDAEAKPDAAPAKANTPAAPQATPPGALPADETHESTASSNGKKYNAWLPPDKSQ
jgi:Sec-independent protein translocase protein TatA